MKVCHDLIDAREKGKFGEELSIYTEKLAFAYQIARTTEREDIPRDPTPTEPQPEPHPEPQPEQEFDALGVSVEVPRPE